MNKTRFAFVHCERCRYWLDDFAAAGDAMVMEGVELIKKMTINNGAGKIITFEIHAEECEVLDTYKGR